MTTDLYVRIARTPEERAYGLMGRTYLPPDHGMLFVFDRLQTGGFWNKNTLIPLDVGFYDAAGRLIEVQALRSIFETDGHVERTPTPSTPYRFALETNRGWFASQGLRRGGLLPKMIVLR